MYSKPKWFIGHTYGHKLVAFRSIETPTEQSHRHNFPAVIGPFKTAKAAKWAERYGLGNPHFQTVNDAERLSRC